MSNKPRKGTGGGKAGEEEIEDPLQAVILADSFENRLRPLTLERPRCLLPLSNTPLIEYTFEFLANSGVEHVYVYCGSLTEQLETYIHNSRWTAPSSPFSRVEIIRSTSRSIGDAMRDLDARNFLVNDFIICYGDIVATLSLADALTAHRTRRLKDKNSIMTMLLTESGRHHRTKPREMTPVFLLDAGTQRCLHYEQIRAGDDDASHTVNIDDELLKISTELDLRTDLLDTGIDICTPEALALWSDNFDFQTPRSNYLHSVLKDYELNGKTLYAHILTDQYAARVRNFGTYAAVSNDMINRWSFPLCPDTNIMRDQTYSMTKNRIYKEQGVILSRSCVINPGTVIGKGSSIGEGTIVTNCIIGRNCIIGKNVKVEGSYIWDNASIGDETSVKRAIVAAEASVGRRCHIEAGAVISFGVHIVDGIRIGENRRITRVKRDTSDAAGFRRHDPDNDIVGKGGDGFTYVASDDEDDDYALQSITPISLYLDATSAFSNDSISTLNSELSDDFEPRSRSAAASFTSVGSDESAMAGTSSHSAFITEAVATIVDGLLQGHDPGNVQIELQNLKITNNASEEAVRKAVTSGFIKRLTQLINNGNTAKSAVDAILPRYKLLLTRTMSDAEASVKTDQVEFLLQIQKDCLHVAEGAQLLLHLCTAFSRDDVIQTEGFEQWWEDERSTGSDELKEVREKTKQLVDFLLADDSEEDDEDEDGSEEDESD